MRSVKFIYLKEVFSLLKKRGINISNKRLRRLAYLDVLQNNYTSYSLYSNYKKIVNKDAADNQLIVLMIVIGLLAALIIFIFI